MTITGKPRENIMRSHGITFKAFEGEIPVPGDLPAESVPPAAPGPV